MQALSAAIRYSCGLGWVLVPPSSNGSSIAIVKSLGRCWPPSDQPLTDVRETVPPSSVCSRQTVTARQRVTLDVSHQLS